MNLRATVNNKTGERRFYVNGLRVTREAYDAFQFWRTVDTLQTVTQGNITRHFCEVR